MGFIIDTGIKNLGLERRKESFYINDFSEDEKDFNIFAFGSYGMYKNPTIEISKEFLKKIIKYFNEHPEELTIQEINPKIKEFLKESNAIEREYSKEALKDSIKAWTMALSSSKLNEEMSISYVLKIHNKLMKNLNPRIAGNIRKVNVGVGNRICLTPEKINYELGKLCKIKPKTEEEIKEWHIKFEEIHPFEDGNGRVGRIIMNIQRLKNNLPILIIHEGEEQMKYYKWFKELS
jgi:Fic family protein